MKKIFVSIAILFPVLFAGCTREMPVTGDELITVNASLSPETRVAFTPEENAMKLSWEASDAIRIISPTKNESYAIVSGFSAHEASFKGKDVEAGPYTVLLPGKYASLAALEARDLSTQTQKGNGSAAHLEYDAVLTGVKDCTSVGFSPDWASANGAEFRENCSLRLLITLPYGTHSASKLTIEASEKAFFSNNTASSATEKLTLDLQDVTVSEEDRLLDCFLDLGLAGARFSAGSVLTFSVATDIGRLFKSIRLGTKVLSGGKMYTVELSGEHWNSSDPFAGGTGTEEDPFRIANYIHMNNIASVLSEGEKIWFKLIADVDMDPKIAGNWDPLNSVSPYDKALDFNGDGHVIRNLTVSGSYQHGGFVSILNGRVRNVTFENSHYVNNYTGDNNDMGIVCAFAGYVVNGREHHANIEHVTVKNSSITTKTVLQTGGVGFGGITGTSVYCAIIDCLVDGFTIQCAGAKMCNIHGGIVGRFLSNQSHVLNSRAVNVELSGNSFIGGIAAYVNTSYAPEITNCSFSGSLNGNAYVGGVLGASRYPVNITGCTSEGKINAVGSYCGGILGGGDCTNKKANDIVLSGCKSSADISSSAVRMGGIVGSLPTNGDCSGGLIEYCEFTGTLTSKTANTGDKAMFYGGIAGVIYNATIHDCVMKGTIIGADYDSHYGGITSYASASSVYNCTFDGKFEEPLGGTVGGIVGALVADGTSVHDNLVVSDVKGLYTVGGVFALDNATTGSRSVTDNLVLGNVIGISAVGGIGGRIQATSNVHTVKGNLMYGASVVSNRSGSLENYRSAGAIVGEIDGTTYVLSDNYHTSALLFQDGVEGVSDRYTSVFEQPGPYDASSAPLSWTGEGTHYHPYHGASTSETASAKAAALGWSAAAWDLSGSVPALVEGQPQ